MTILNSKNEVADFQDENQFSGGKTAYACVAFSAALLKYMGQPGHGATGSGMDIATLAYYWYGKLEGSDSASNTNGMSLGAEYTMLKGLGLSYEPLAASVDAVKAALSQGRPVLFCGAETGMHDMALGDAVPYSWPASGNHAIVISGIAPDGNLLVHDCASIAPSGVRSGPRIYDASKLQPVSATAIIPSWLTSEEDMGITATDPTFLALFERIDDQHYRSKSNGKTLQYGNLLFYLAENGPKRLGDLLSNEVVMDAHGNTFQACANGVIYYDPQHIYGGKGQGNSYFGPAFSGFAWNAAMKDQNTQIATLTSEIATLKAAAVIMPNVGDAVSQLEAAQAANGVIGTSLSKALTDLKQ